MKSSPVFDPTTHGAWLDEQQHRLAGFEILNHALKGEERVLSPAMIREKTGGNQKGPDQIYRMKFIPLLLKSLGATNFEEALTALRRERDEIR